MRQGLFLALSFSLVAPLSAVSAGGSPAPYTATGWLSCDRCVGARAKAGQVGPTGRDCAQRCIADGAATVFLDEKATAAFRVTNPEAVKGQESHYVRVRGALDSSAGTLEVSSVEVLKSYVAQCGRPKSSK